MKIVNETFNILRAGRSIFPENSLRFFAMLVLMLFVRCALSAGYKLFVWTNNNLMNNRKKYVAFRPIVHDLRRRYGGIVENIPQ